MARSNPHTSSPAKRRRSAASPSATAKPAAKTNARVARTTGEKRAARELPSPAGAPAGTPAPEGARARLLRAAAHLFLTRGYAQTTVRDLAREVGILSGSIFHHFESKEAILEAVMTEVSTRRTEHMQRVAASEATPVTRVRALLRSELESIHGESGEAMTLLVSEWRSLSPAAQRRVLALRERYERVWLLALRAAQASLPAMEVFLVRRFVQGMTAGTAHWYRPRGALSLDQLTDHILTLLIHRRPT